MERSTLTVGNVRAMAKEVREKKKSLKIAVDFDGSVVDHRYPAVGEDVPHAVEVMKELVAEGHKLILFTMRSGEDLETAKQWFADRSVELYAVQKDKGQFAWTQSNKCYANKYIDDAAVGCPLIEIEGFDRPCVDWLKVKELL